MTVEGFGQLIQHVPVGTTEVSIYPRKVLRELSLSQREYTHREIFQAMEKANVPSKQWKELISAMEIRGELKERKSDGRHIDYTVPTIVKLKIAFYKLLYR